MKLETISDTDKIISTQGPLTSLSQSFQPYHTAFISCQLNGQRSVKNAENPGKFDHLQLRDTRHKNGRRYDSDEVKMAENIWGIKLGRATT